MPKSIYQVKSAIGEIMNDVTRQAFTFLIHHPQNSDRLNVLIMEASRTTEKLTHRLNDISKFTDDKLKEIELDALAKDLKKESLIHLSELQKIKEKEDA